MLHFSLGSGAWCGGPEECASRACRFICRYCHITPCGASNTNILLQSDQELQGCTLGTLPFATIGRYTMSDGRRRGASCACERSAGVTDFTLLPLKGSAMDNSTMDQISRMQRSDPRIESLVERHLVLEERIRVLTARDHLTPAESVEMARLKKEKLGVRDEIETLLHVKSA